VYLAKTYTPPDFAIPELVSTTPTPAPTPPLPSPVIKSTSDSKPPTTPLKLTGVLLEGPQINLSWNASTDNKKVAGYKIFRNGIEIASTIDIFYGDGDVPYKNFNEYKIIAYDTSGNVSLPSNTINIATTFSKSSTPPPASPQSSPAPAPIAPAPVTPPLTTPPATTPPPASSCESGGSCTASEVASHNSAGNCWVYLRSINKVYNITAYVANPGQHPGGNVIISYCGMDIYDYFIDRAGGHRHSNTALNSILQSYYIGPFQP
ncbi:MAG: cytochrome b5-like heme/steroid binding domain-containing protein, partial [Patescibacteria group bacterium]